MFHRRLHQNEWANDMANRLFDSDTQRHCAAKRAGELTPRGAMPLRAGQLQR
jgi:hypothetical protein